MIWNNECRKTRRLLALWVGNDLDERDAAGVERHLAVCPHCREVRQGLHQSQQALDASRPAVSRTDVARTDVARTDVSRTDVSANRQLSTSVWPGVARHISSIDERAGLRGWHDWLPTGALAAACVAMIAALVPPVRTGDYQLTSESVRVVVGSDSGRLQPVSSVSPRIGVRPGQPALAPAADPDSYRNF